MILRPPRSTLFPTRRSSDLHVCVLIRLTAACLGNVPSGQERQSSPPASGLAYICSGFLLPLIWKEPRLRQFLTRSEEHTSELQSRQYLVCRLLLEKKNNKEF